MLVGVHIILHGSWIYEIRLSQSTLLNGRPLPLKRGCLVLITLEIETDTLCNRWLHWMCENAWKLCSGKYFNCYKPTSLHLFYMHLCLLILIILPLITLKSLQKQNKHPQKIGGIGLTLQLICCEATKFKLGVIMSWI